MPTFEASVVNINDCEKSGYCNVRVFVLEFEKRIPMVETKQGIILF